MAWCALLTQGSCWWPQDQGVGGEGQDGGISLGHVFPQAAAEAGEEATYEVVVSNCGGKGAGDFSFENVRPPCSAPRCRGLRGPFGVVSLCNSAVCVCVCSQ